MGRRFKEISIEDEETWKSVLVKGGSVQHLDFLTQEEKDVLYIWQNRYEGEIGKKHPTSKGFKYSWAVFLNNSEATIEIITGKEDTPKIRCYHCEEKEFKLFRTKLLTAFKRKFYENSKYVKAYFEIFFHDKKYKNKQF